MLRPAARPLLALLLLILWMGVTALTGRSAPEEANLSEIAMSGLLRQIAFAAALMALAAVLLRWPGLGLGPPRRGTLRLLWLPGLYLAAIGAVAATVGLPPALPLAFLLANMLLVGFSEEMMFRGFLWTGLRERVPLWPAALVTSVVFGAVHVLNVLGTGHLQAALLQSAAATFLGLLLLGLRLRMDSIWPAILVHALWNFGLLLVGRGQPPLPPEAEIPAAAGLGLLLALLPLGLYGLWLIRLHARDGGGPGPRPPAAVPLSPWGTPRA